VAPIAPEPPVPEVSMPVKLITVMDDDTFSDNEAVTLAPLRVVAENARQISAVPRCVLERNTSVHVSPPPLTLLTLALLPPPEASVEINARSNSLAALVENVAVFTLDFADP